MKMIVFIVFLIVLNSATAIGVVYNQYEKRMSGIEMSRIDAEKHRMMEKWSQLLVEHASWGANGRIERIAREQLNMKYEYKKFFQLEI